MNFVITRAELCLITAIARTESFNLQKNGTLKVLSYASKKGWFDLTQVLFAIAAYRGLPPPTDKCVQSHAQLVVQLRCGKRLKHISNEA